jgi:uncharacterized protein
MPRRKRLLLLCGVVAFGAVALVLIWTSARGPALVSPDQSVATEAPPPLETPLLPVLLAPLQPALPAPPHDPGPLALVLPSTLDVPIKRALKKKKRIASRRPRRSLTTADKILRGARRVVERGTRYAGREYRWIDYPQGDLPLSIGVCTDLVVRAFRNAGVDLQRLVHEDRARRRNAYPTYPGERGVADSNIDHRRCGNLTVFFKRFAEERTTHTGKRYMKDWRAGDVVFFRRKTESKPWHIAVISDRFTADGIPYMVHLNKPRASEEPITQYLPVHSHFRWKTTSN